MDSTPYDQCFYEDTASIQNAKSIDIDSMSLSNFKWMFFMLFALHVLVLVFFVVLRMFGRRPWCTDCQTVVYIGRPLCNASQQRKFGELGHKRPAGEQTTVSGV